MKSEFVKPGEIHFAKEPTCIRTIIGSCVAVCLYDKKNHWGGLCHYALPERGPLGMSTSNDNNYGNLAIPNLIREFKRSGSNKNDLIAKVLGGGEVLNDLDHNKNMMNFAEKNISTAFKLLKQFDIPVTGKSVGGKLGRNIVLYSNTGDVEFKLIQKTSTPDTSKLPTNQNITLAIVESYSGLDQIIKENTHGRNFAILPTVHSISEVVIQAKSNPQLIIFLDIQLYRKEGSFSLKELLTKDVSVIIFSRQGYVDSKTMVEALEFGAFDCICNDSSSTDLGEKLISTIDAAAASLIARKKFSPAGGGPPPKRMQIDTNALSTPDLTLNLISSKLLAIGASTGGVEAVTEVLIRLPKIIPPLLIVQHIPPVFSASWANRLNELCPFTVKEARDGELVENGVAYVAPGGFQMGVKEEGTTLRLTVRSEPPVNRFRPSVDYLFLSLSKIKRRKVIAVIMTGMGNDGAEGLLQLKNMGAKTFAQDEASSVVFGMPKVAIEMGAANKIVPLAEIHKNLLESCWK
ncbi:MAG: hypothetical protein HQK50_14385 [Oligoflexia bacterium]|nr:hypothetical protein [Oligoflexia bacterium]MBF0366758.1 hypothetical protein [Oligoflexia bacterium]